MSKKIRIIGVIGYPIKHSLSPVMQNAAFRAAGLNYRYLPFEVKPEECFRFIRLLPRLGFAGINITVPHKETAYNSVDYLSREAKLAGAVNTIKVHNKKLYGTSTDGEGLLRSLKMDADFVVKGKSIIILGAGGAGRSIAAYLATKGAERIIIANRTPGNALKAVALVRKASPLTIVFAIKLKDKFVRFYSNTSDLIINATSVGLNTNDTAVISHKAIRKGIIFYDLIYNPEVTSNIKEAKKGGAKTYNGLGMLLHQGAVSFEFWTGKKAPLSVMKRALQKGLREAP